MKNGDIVVITFCFGSDNDVIETNIDGTEKKEVKILLSRLLLEYDFGKEYGVVNARDSVFEIIISVLNGNTFSVKSNVGNSKLLRGIIKDVLFRLDRIPIEKL